MRVLYEEDVDITGFASIRERVLLQSRDFFRHQPSDESFAGFGSLLYLANAWFIASGSTGLHHHEGVDIVSIIPRGEMLHRGSIGNDERVQVGQVQIQRSGEQGFSHNEINPTDQPQPFIQLWLQPEKIAEQASFDIVDIKSNAITPIYQSFDTQLSILEFNQAQQWQAQSECLVFVYAGTGLLQKGEEVIELKRGMLIKAQQPLISSHDELKALIVEK